MNQSSNMKAYKSSENSESLVTHLSSFHKEEVARNYKYMSSLIEAIVHTAKRGIPLIGHNNELIQ